MGREGDGMGYTVVVVADEDLGGHEWLLVEYDGVMTVAVGRRALRRSPTRVLGEAEAAAVVRSLPSSPTPEPAPPAG